MKKQSEILDALTLSAVRDENGNVTLCHPVSGDIVGTFPAHYEDCPKDGDTHATINCVKRPIIWHGKPVTLKHW